MEWQNIGYETPYDSTIMASGMQFGNEGDFRADVIEITLENHSGGSQRACLIRRGEIYLDEHNIAAALSNLGLQHCGSDLLQEDSTDLLKRIPMDSNQGLRVLCCAAQAFTGFDDHEALVAHVGMPRWRDSRPKTAQHRFDGDITFYPDGTSLEAILRDLCNDFNNRTESDQADAAPCNIASGPFAGLTRDINTRADLCRLGGFRDLARDPNGNPVVYEEDGTWIGPEEPELVAMWKDFPDQKPEHEHEPGLNSRP